MPKSLYLVRQLSEFLKIEDMIELLRDLNKKPMSHKDILKKRYINGDDKKLSRRLDKIKTLKLIEKKGIIYEDTGYNGTQYRLTKKGKELVKKLYEVDDLLRSK